MTLSKEDLQSIRQITQEVTAEVADCKQEQLAVMINSSLEKVEKRFEAVEQHLRSVDKRLDEQTTQTADIKLTLADHGLLLHRIDRRTHDQQQRLDHHEMRLRRLEKHQGLRPLPGTVDG